MVLRQRAVERRYQIGRRIAIGERAEIYEAKAEEIARPLLLKRLIPRGADIKALFVREAAVSACLDHPNLIEVIDLDHTGQSFSIIMENVGGMTLAETLACLEGQGQKVPVEVALGLIGQLARGLAHAHERALPDGSPLGIVHRAVSADNVLLGKNGIPKLGDFSLATFRGHEITQAGVVRGKSRSFSPEQARGEPVDPRTDVYALGALLFQMLAGQPLHGGAVTNVLIEQIARGQRDSLSARLLGCEQELIEIVEHAVHVDREARMHTARELERKLDGYRAAREMRVDTDTFSNLIAPFVEQVEAARPPTQAGELEGRTLVLQPDEIPETGDLKIPQRESVAPPGDETGRGPRRKKRLERLERIERPNLPRLPSLPRPVRGNDVDVRRLSSMMAVGLGLLIAVICLMILFSD